MSWTTSRTRTAAVVFICHTSTSDLQLLINTTSTMYKFTHYILLCRFSTFIRLIIHFVITLSLFHSQSPSLKPTLATCYKNPFTVTWTLPSSLRSDFVWTYWTVYSEHSGFAFFILASLFHFSRFNWFRAVD